MNIKRYIVVQAIQKRDNTLVPIWDAGVSFQETENYGNQITLNNDFHEKHYNVVECIYDLKSRKLSMGIEIDYYPSEKDLTFKIGETVLWEEKHRFLKETKIVNIVYEEYDLTIIKGKKLESYEIKAFNIGEVVEHSLYAIKYWKPFYILENGTKIEYSHQLFHKA